METNFNLKEALKETKKRYSLEEKAEIILQIIKCKMKEQDINADAVAAMEVKCKLIASQHLHRVPQPYEIIASVIYLSGEKMEIYRTNLTLNHPSEKNILMNPMVEQAKKCDFAYNLFNDFNGEIRLRIRL